ncbi:PH domain-containing protein [Streptomyces sp. NPDC003717]|uniref:PH domain-containing protein n=1 Tax=Streptomyces sp. NPDC003717 TaxID=3154276 RepID=UPI0033AFF446
MVEFSVRPDIDAAAGKLASSFGAKREIESLPEVLAEGETVELLAAGLYGKGNGLLVMTDRRLVFYFRGRFGQKVEDFPYGRISSVQWTAGMLMGTLTVFTSGNRAEIRQVPKDQGKALADQLRQRVARTGEPPADVPDAGSARDVASRLRTLDELRAADAITDEEHRDRRARILDSL